MDTLIETVLDNEVFLVMTTLALLAAGHGLRRIAGAAGALLERRWASRQGGR